MTLSQLKYIVAVDTYRSFSTAAERAFVTQPTLSMQIQKVEEELGLILFDRSKKPIVPTESGQWIIEQARTVLRESEKIKQHATTESQEMKGQFKVAIIPTLAPYLLALFVKSFVAKYPRVELILEELPTRQITDKLNQDLIDAGVLATPLHIRGLVERPLFYEPFVAYVSEDHRLGRRNRIALKDLDLNDMWILAEGHCFRGQAIQLCSRTKRGHDVRPGPLRFDGGNLDTLRKLVEDNFGMTLLPYLAVQELDAVRRQKYVREFSNPVPRREISLVFNRAYLKRRLLDAMAEAIIAAVPPVLLEKKHSLIVA